MYKAVLDLCFIAMDVAYTHTRRENESIRH